MDSARKRIAAFHEGERPSGAVLRLVYFHPADREPLADYQARLDRIMTDISEFYREELDQRYGVKSAGVPLERKDGKLVIRMVRGRHPAAHYQHDSGDETWSEIRKALAGVFDADREHVLVLYGLCERAPDGRFIFNAPYYGAGWSDHRRGLCHAADCERLDTLLLTRKDEPFVFTEHYYPRMEMSVAKFNSWYLGGLAHELGHGLGFPHDNGGPGEAPGHALMGDGNFHYRENLWGAAKPSYLSLATALRFAAHPLVTQSNKVRWQVANAQLENFSGTADKHTLQLTGRFASEVPPCAVIASAWPTTDKTNHGARTFCAAVDDDGKFSILIKALHAPSWHLELGCLLVNGAESRHSLSFRCDEEGKPNVEKLIAEWTVDAAEQRLMRQPAVAGKFLSDEAIAAVQSGEGRRQLRLLRAMRDPQPEPVDLVTTDAARIFLSDARWNKAEVGWGQVARNRFWFTSDQWEGMLLKLDGVVFDKGLYAHSKSKYVFPTGGKWKTFSAVVGLRDGAGEQGSAVFTILGDGRELFRSKILRPRQSQAVRVGIESVQELELRADGGEGHNHNSWAIWADPLVEK